MFNPRFLPVVGVDADSGVEREAVEVGGAAGPPERIREAEPPVHLDRLEGGEGVLVGAGPVPVAARQAEASNLPDDGGEERPHLLVLRRRDGDEPRWAGARHLEDPVGEEGVEVDVLPDLGGVVAVRHADRGSKGRAGRSLPRAGWIRFSECRDHE